MENIRIAIVGNIGVGKSTLVKAASSEPLKYKLLEVYPDRETIEDVYAFQEEFDPIVLDAFYKDPVKYAFMAQNEFFNGRLDRQIKIMNCRGIVLEDRTLHEDYHIFGKAQRILNNMTEAEFRTYSRTFHLMTEKINPLDLVVYLRADVDTVVERIARRGRESEKSIDRDYLELLNELYEEYTHRYVECPVLVIDANKKNDLSKDSFLKKTIDAIADKVKTLDLRVSSPGI
ncbi:MAG: deoxynucleoside kinase [Candidatus Cloacimonetes bacterium]|nr:deoxynucleoside kinase [Candidatus Cloacimonadota bacterium]